MYSKRIVTTMKIELNEEPYKVMVHNLSFILLQRDMSGDFFLVLNTERESNLDLVFKVLRMMNVYDVRIALNLRYSVVFALIQRMYASTISSLAVPGTIEH